MVYMALKSLRFDKEYQRGEEIPAEVIAPAMIEKLKCCGVITEIGGGKKKEKTERQMEQQRSSIDTKDTIMKQEKTKKV